MAPSFTPPQVSQTRPVTCNSRACAVPFCCPMMDGMKYAYTRTSTDDQSSTLQLAVLSNVGRTTLYRVLVG
jgi:sulfite exporter TauE/SafE